jgi:hypothetical protein
MARRVIHTFQNVERKGGWNHWLHWQHHIMELLSSMCSTYVPLNFLETLLFIMWQNIDPTRIGHQLINQTIATACHQPPNDRVFDPQLDHWGIAPLPDEDFFPMLARLTSPGGPLSKWSENNYNGFFDNSIAGVHALNTIIGEPAKNVYYFTLSCGATISTLASGKLGRFANKVLGLIPRGIVKPPHNALQLSPPGSQLPRADMFPAFPIFGYAMGGYQLTAAQKRVLGCRSVDMHQNDGVVNTASMRGPRGSTIVEVDRTVGEVERGKFYHLGRNDTLDHADAIGIVVDTDLVGYFKNIYILRKCVVLMNVLGSEGGNNVFGDCRTFVSTAAG